MQATPHESDVRCFLHKFHFFVSAGAVRVPHIRCVLSKDTGECAHSADLEGALR